MNKQISNRLDNEKESIAEQVLKLQYEIQPELKQQFGQEGYEKCKVDTIYHLSYLAEAIAQKQTNLFESYLTWVKVLMESLKIGTQHMIVNLECTITIVSKMFPVSEHEIILKYLNAGLNHLKSDSVDLPTFMAKDLPLADLADKYLEFILNAEKYNAMDLINHAVQSGVSINDLYLYVFQKTQYEIGRLWQINKISVAQEHYCTSLTQVIMSQLYPLILKNRKERNRLRFLGLCITSELHELGIRMVCDFLELNGWDTHYLGAGMPEHDILKAIKDISPDIIGISATLAINISKVEHLIEEVKKQFSDKRPQIIVGGCPFNICLGLWKNIGADGYSVDAKEAVVLCNKLVLNKGNWI
ncbi:cobalamin-dependent protein [Petroclostridium sp. X23]|uniref:cobalamin B12-binding domain-containing protein n=1 Tax=Petroclostridium sp. X23 TaxID=3045146 RepID=UPI0024ACC8AF|nr:cobalamin-dependent protein [Petroclostridium sp. X23]WHH61350.1 cobalamin-dependent protein [Petroclostridium sp. X23]